MSERLIVIGGGGSGTAAATIAKRCNPDLHVTLFSEFPDIALDPRTITARNKHEGFDKLIVCTGFLWEQPAVPGANLEGLHYVKDIRRAMEFDKELDQMKRAVVIGGMWLGVEMAGALARRGLEVQFIDEGPWLLS